MLSSVQWERTPHRNPGQLPHFSLSCSAAASTAPSCAKPAAASPQTAARSHSAVIKAQSFQSWTLRLLLLWTPNVLLKNKIKNKVGILERPDNEAHRVSSYLEEADGKDSTSAPWTSSETWSLYMVSCENDVLLQGSRFIYYCSNDANS